MTEAKPSPAEAKAAREKEARAQLFAQKGNVRPESTNIAALLGPELAAELEPPTAADTQPAEPAITPQPEIKAEAPAKPKKTAPAPVQATPWANAHPKVTVPFMMRLPEDLHMQLTWLKEHLPNTSIQKLVRVAIEKEVAALIKENYK